MNSPGAIEWLYACWLLRRALSRLSFSGRKNFWIGLRVYVTGSDTTWFALPDAFTLMRPHHVRAAVDYADAILRAPLVEALMMTEAPTSQMSCLTAAQLAQGYVPVDVTTQVSTMADGKIQYWWAPGVPHQYD